MDNIGRKKGRQYTPTRHQRDTLRRIVDVHTQAYVASHAEVSRPTISRLYNDPESSTSIRVWRRLCQAWPSLAERRTDEEAAEDTLQRADDKALLREALRAAGVVDSWE
jgi:hypothetical protein